VCFETFPFSVNMNLKSLRSGRDMESRFTKIETAASELLDMRERWLFPPELVTRLPEVVVGYPDRRIGKDSVANSELKLRTVTELYNQAPFWLKNVHAALDEAVAAAYGWEWPIPDEEILRRLFQLNRQRAAPLDARPLPKKAGKK
jgi:hypothetical protein